MEGALSAIQRTDYYLIRIIRSLNPLTALV
jgi:hypothetical protein